MCLKNKKTNKNKYLNILYRYFYFFIIYKDKFILFNKIINNIFLI